MHTALDSGPQLTQVGILWAEAFTPEKKIIKNIDAFNMFDILQNEKDIDRTIIKFVYVPPWLLEGSFGHIGNGTIATIVMYSEQ